MRLSAVHAVPFPVQRPAPSAAAGSGSKPKMTVINTNISALTAHNAQRSVNNMVRLAM
jgi:hypothetical protein